MITIYKYTLPMSDQVVVPMPKGARILAVQEQHGEPRVWARVDTEQPLTYRHFAIRGTGNDIEGLPDTHIGTFQLRGGSYVFHVFDLGEQHG